MEHRFQINYNTKGFARSIKIDAPNQRQALCKFYFGVSKLGFEFEDIKIEKLFRIW